MACSRLWAFVHDGHKDRNAGTKKTRTRTKQTKLSPNLSQKLISLDCLEHMLWNEARNTQTQRNKQTLKRKQTKKHSNRQANQHKDTNTQTLKDTQTITHKTTTQTQTLGGCRKSCWVHTTALWRVSEDKGSHTASALVSLQGPNQLSPYTNTGTTLSPTFLAS